MGDMMEDLNTPPVDLSIELDEVHNISSVFSF